MNAVISRRARDLIAQSRRAMPAGEPGLIHLDSGDPDFETPEPIRNALAEAVAAGHVHYANPQGDLELRSALAALVSARSEEVYEPDQILVTHGATGALAAAILGLIDPGHRVVVPEPTYSLYPDLVQLAGGQIQYVPTFGPDFDLDLEMIAAALLGARLLILCNPCNPTGAVYSEARLRQVAEMARRLGVFVISDEAYDHIVYDGVSHTSLLSLGLGELGVYVQSFSKTYAMTGWRIGYVAASRKVIAGLTRLHRTVNGPVNSAVQRAALAALQMDGEWSARMLREYHRRRDLVLEGIAGTGAQLNPPAGTFYAFLRYPPGLSSVAMTALAVKHGVALRPGIEYGPSGEGYLRLAFSASAEEIALGVERLAAAFHEAAAGDGGR